MFRTAFAALLAFAAPVAAADAERGTLKVPADDPKAPVVERYRLAEYSGEYNLSLRYDLRHSGVTVYDLTFPSPVKSDIAENNTVYAEYFVPKGRTKCPAVVVLDIMQGNQLIARGEAMWLAQNGVASLVVLLPHYNQRRAPNSKVKLVSPDIARTLDGIRQGVLDCRCACAWLAARAEVDPDSLGMVGTSLGSFLTALTSANEPRIKNVCMVLGGGGLVDAYYDHPKARPVTEWVDRFGGKNLVKKLIAPVDPITYAAQLKGKNLLMIAAREDEIVPPKAATQLWEATGKQRIVWLDAGHITAAFYTMSVLREMRDHVGGK
ncbi:MAG: alpha/beta hydrolase family protein [Planctomycetes bacterium]|nr:alpha/beta hydrolase family protein [Planctomycetota bacterium]